MGRKIYLDHAATTATSKDVLQAMLPFFEDSYGNPSGAYSIATENKREIEKSRQIIAGALNTVPESIFFTAGGSEADNWAIKGIAEAYREKGRHIITTKLEHHAILNTCEYLKKRGYEITYLNTDERGMIRIEELLDAIRDDTILIAVMYANNEIGTIQPIKEIGEIAKRNSIIFHTDAVQAFGQIPIDVENDCIDLLSASGHKLQGPKGVGFLYVREGIDINNFIHGGKQERGKRAGTENVPGIVGIGKATEIAVSNMQKKIEKEVQLRDYLINRILSEIPYSRLNGAMTKRLPNNVNISFQFVEGETMLIMLDMAGIFASAGSACTTGTYAPSHVLTAIGLPKELAHGSLRLTVGEENTMEEMEYVVDTLIEIINKLREDSPAYEDYNKICRIYEKNIDIK